MHGISVWRKGIHRPGGQFCLRASLGWRGFARRKRRSAAASPRAVPRDCSTSGRSTAVVWILGAFYLLFSSFSFLFFRDRATLMKSGHEWAIDSVHVAGGNFSPKCRAYEYGYFESVVREIRRCNWKRRMFSGMCFFFCFSFFFR